MWRGSSLALIPALAFAASCGSNPQPAQPGQRAATDGTEPVVVAKSAEQKSVELHEAYGKALAANDTAAMLELYAEDATFVPAGSGMVITGRDQIVGFFGQFAAGFDDWKSDPLIVLAKGTTLAAVSRTTMVTKEGMGMPAGRTVGFTALSISDVRPEGTYGKTIAYADNLNFYAQVDAYAVAHRNADAGAAPAVATQMSTGAAPEQSNIATAKALAAALNQGNRDAVRDLYADDALVRNQAMTSDYRGRVEIGGYYDARFDSFSRLAIQDIGAWAAGDYVVMEYSLSGYNDKQLARFDIPATNRSFSLEAADVLRIEDGSITEHWVFYDGMMLGIQLGAIGMPGSEPAAPATPADKPDA
jgi:uncharacterized protein (TIGR02246 family)